MSNLDSKFINYKNIDLLKRYITETGKIVPGRGHYLFYYVEGTPENVSEIENKIKFNDMIIRHLFVKINNVPDFESDLKEDSAKEEDKPKKATKSADKKEETKKDDDKKSDDSKETADEVGEEEKVTEDKQAENEKEETKDE